MSTVDRRTFIEQLGGGILVAVTLGPRFAEAQGSGYPDDPNVYLRIASDGRVTVFSGKIEMGQGIHTSLGQMIAEELGASLESIDLVLGDTDRCPWDMGTFGSLTTRMFGPALRAAGAEARAVLVGLAAEKLRVPKERLVVEKGVISVKGEPNRKVSFGELAKGQAISRLVGEKALLRQVSEFEVMGRPQLRRDGRDKVTGAAQFAGDIRLPGMLAAKVLRPPAHGARLLSVDSAEAAAIPGVTVARDGDLVAVLHADPDRAAFALARVKATWAPAPEGADHEGIFDELVAKATAPPQVRASKGSVDAVPPGSRRFENTYRKPYVAHAPIEPHTALAVMEGGRLTVWASTQTPFPLQDQVAAATGLDKKAVRIIAPFVGGGFGGKTAGPQAIEAARLARLTSKPVQVAFSREEEFFYDYFDPACVVRIVSALDGQGRITLWDYDVYYAGDRAAELFYDVPNLRIRTFGERSAHRFAVGPWRAPGANMNVFARESQIDVMAAAAGIDPLDLRLRNITDPRARGVYEAAAQAFGWTPHTAPRRNGTGIGIACGVDSGTYAALAVQVKVDRSSGELRVERVVCAQDMGVVVNPEGAKMQIEGCVTMGLGYALSEELVFRGGEVLTQNYDTYELPRFSWLPKIEAVIVRNDALPPQGGGEPAIVPMGGAIANAVFDATGVRVMRLPMTRARLKAALPLA